ncbi:hypothetical protein JG688_00009584 [Phytophthora aleatoria]|uniref:Uncharacterized protein n=1 Tax=Phytophthora aleatoria TaxID=2496075 RepID=A0A8J5IG66_9STRA|nr:hypothetical protein PI125_g9842 [Phytophthora idaei]KAG6960446.1 hypothetical protein JG688_00009584 [Phytophthora aleatoria]
MTVTTTTNSVVTNMKPHKLHRLAYKSIQSNQYANQAFRELYQPLNPSAQEAHFI